MATHLIEEVTTIIFNSNASISTPLNPTTFNNEYAITLNNAISVPVEAKNCYVGLIAANVWNFDTNIREPNNKFYFTPNLIDPLEQLTIPPGYYGLSDLNSQISIQLQLAGFPGDLFNLQGDAATQKVIIQFSTADTQIDFTLTDTIREIVGFDSRLSPLAPSTVDELDVSDNIAQFNSVNEFLISCPALVDDGIPINVIGNGILGSIAVTSPPNSLIVYNPNQVKYVSVPGLIGNKRSEIQFTLLNELLEDVTVLDPFTFTVRIRWLVER